MLSNRLLVFLLVVFAIAGCKTEQVMKTENRSVPTRFSSLSPADTASVATIKWREYFSDPYLIALIDSALIKNQELNIVMQEIAISRNEVKARKGEYLPFLGVQAGAGVEKEGLYTRHGAVDEQLEIEPGKPFPEPLPDYQAALVASWEVDVWKKLRNAKKAASLRYLASVEGKNFMVTNLVAEVADSYYELLALDNLLAIVQQNIEIQTDALAIVRQQKDAARLTQLAVNRFQAQLLNTKNLQYEIRQQIIETENRIRFLTGNFDDSVQRSSTSIAALVLDSALVGIPSLLLENRPDIRQAELQLTAARIDVNVARANFYPSFSITAGVGFQAFNPSYLLKPESMLYNLAGDLMAPLLNRNAIQAAYNTATAKQIQAVYAYEQAVLNAYVDVVNQLTKADNYSNSYQTKSEEVEILLQSVDISNSLFRSARADYLEVLLTQREALESKMELIEIRTKQLNAKVGVYRALGGGWN